MKDLAVSWLLQGVLRVKQKKARIKIRANNRPKTHMSKDTEGHSSAQLCQN
jgi:hypothetical protein